MKTGALTALQEFTRLEAFGRWTPAPNKDPQDVSVFFGEATLVIANGDGRPMTHWSLPAIRRLNAGESPARYAPDSDDGETLEIGDEAMIAAIEKVHKAIALSQPKPGLLRRSAKILLAVAAVSAVFWLPGALQRKTLSIVPATTRQDIGATLLAHIQGDVGSACRSPAGNAALDRLVTRLFAGQALGQDARQGLRIVILPGEMASPLSLPGGLIVMPESALTLADDPYVFAGAVVAATTPQGNADPLARTLDATGIGATLTLLVRGKLSAETLESHADALLAQGQTLADVATLRRAFENAALTSTPWARAVHGGSELQSLTIDDPMEGKDAPTVLSDADWISLKTICTI